MAPQAQLSLAKRSIATPVEVGRHAFEAHGYFDGVLVLRAPFTFSHGVFLGALAATDLKSVLVAALGLPLGLSCGLVSARFPSRA